MNNIRDYFNIYNYINDTLKEAESKIEKLYPKNIRNIFYTVYSNYVSFNIMNDNFEWTKLNFDFNQFPLKDEDIINEINNPKVIHITVIF